MISNILQLLGFQPRTSTSITRTFFLTVGQNNFGNKIQFYALAFSRWINAKKELQVYEKLCERKCVKIWILFQKIFNPILQLMRIKQQSKHLRNQVTYLFFSIFCFFFWWTTPFSIKKCHLENHRVKINHQSALYKIMYHVGTWHNFSSYLVDCILFLVILLVYFFLLKLYK